MVGGSIVFTFPALMLVALWTNCTEDDICLLLLLFTCIMFFINIWGAVVVFGKLWASQAMVLKIYTPLQMFGLGQKVLSRLA